MKLFVTGGTGFFGAHFLKAAVEAGHEIFALRRSRDPQIPIPPAVTWVPFSDPSEVSRMLEESDALVHLAAAGVAPAESLDWRKCFEVNLTWSLRFWREASAAGVRKLLLCGSCAEYGETEDPGRAVKASDPLRPIGAYAASKAAASIAAIGLAKSEGFSLQILRPFHIYGEGEAPHRFWPSLLRAVELGQDLPMSSGAQIRDFTPVGQAAAAFCTALNNWPAPGQVRIQNVGTGMPQTLLEFAKKHWTERAARGKLLPGVIPLRPNELMRTVPDLAPVLF